MDVHELYRSLFDFYGPQGWWPLASFAGTNPTMRGRLTGYHPNNYKLPANEKQILEIMLGAILTQNTSWINAEKAIFNLIQHDCIDIAKILATPLENLGEIIRSSGYYNQKAIKLQSLMRFLQENPIKELNLKTTSDLRSIFLTVKGIGPETCDSILLYALKRPIFVVDAYTKRILGRLGIMPYTTDYDAIQHYIHNTLTPSTEIYNEFHALLVQHAVHQCLKEPQCDSCNFNSICPKIINLAEKKIPRKPKRT
jgi:endonuclease-3 related protein